jgi:hypothetical protein
VFTVHLPAAFRGQTSVVAYVASHRRTLRVGAGRSVRIDFRGITTQQGRGVAVAIWGRRTASGRRAKITRIYTLCTTDGVGQFNVPPSR